MKERPILFSAPMVRAILDGSKTQTRRALKAQPTEVANTGRMIFLTYGNHGAGERVECRCPYGKPGDRLWVREAWRERVPDQDGRTDDYRADYPGLTRANDPCGVPWKPSIHMPRGASRILLEVTEIRVERLQAINRGDAMDEGCPFANMAHGPDPRQWYAELWNSINGAGAWDGNPWCWCVSFRRLAS